MDTRSLQSLIRRFLQAHPSDPFLQEHGDTHEQRKQAANRLLQLKHIPNLTREEWQAFLQDTDSWYGLRRNKAEFWRGMFGELDELLPKLRTTLANLVRRADAGLTATDFNELKAALPGIGTGFLSEILALRLPDHYWPLNKPVRKFLEDHGIKIKEELPWGKKADEGEQYMVAGRHLEDVRRALSEAAGRRVDYMFTDLFIYWVSQQGDIGIDPWTQRVERWRAERWPDERSQARLEAEASARILLETRAGEFDEGDLSEFLSSLNVDWWDGKHLTSRFVPAFSAPQEARMVETLDALNSWVKRIWQADDAELDALLDDFWKQREVGGAGTSLPTAVLYLRDREQYGIWLPVMSKALQIATGFEPGKWRRARSYRRYNVALNQFRERYQVPPHGVDDLLWWIATKVGIGNRKSPFTGFSEDTFRFLRELAANNSSEWMHRDEDANEKRYQRVLREPLRSLFQAVGPSIADMDPAFETEAKFGKVMASIGKRWPDDEGPYHTYLWGAFYRQDHTRQTDAQLYVVVNPDHLNVGFSVAGARGLSVLQLFRRNLRQAPKCFLEMLRSLPEDIHVATTAGHGLTETEILPTQSQGDLQLLFEHDLIDIERRYPADHSTLSQPEFADEVSDLFEALYPLYLFATTEDEDELTRLCEGVPNGDGPPPARYSMGQLCTDTYCELDFWQEVELLIRDKKQLILYGPPGTGKTFVAQKFGRYWTEAAPDPNGEMKVVQFHPSYAYEEFVEGIRPKSVEGSDGRIELSYPVKKGVFREFCEDARRHRDRRYVLILDEMNRGELPRILGELLYLLEYRREAVTLPYSGDPFAIPDNVYLIGTMNTADRSIALVDHALRRRFHFVEMRPDPSILRAYFEGTSDIEMTWTADLLEELNRQLLQDGIEWHLHIGHSHFMRSDLDDRWVRLIWKHSVMPTLEEYFYRQPERLKAYDLSTLKATLGQA